MQYAILTALSGSLLLCSAAPAQSLSERIDHMMKQRAANDGRTSKGAMLGALLYTDLTIDFNETPVRDAMNHIQQILGINIVGRYNDDRSGEGIDPDLGITVSVENTPALTVLEMILEQCEDYDECTWQLRTGFVEIGTKNRLASRGAQELRYYPIRDLLMEVPYFDNAPDLDLDSALAQGQGGGGGGQGGGGGGGGFGGGGGGGGGGQGGGQGGGGGSIFGGSGDDPELISEEEKVQKILDLIYELVEPDGWQDMGGDWATMRYYQGTLIIRAPDFVHRQINGYPFAISPVRKQVSGQRPGVIDRRYVHFTSGFSNVEIIDIKPSAPVTGNVGPGGG